MPCPAALVRTGDKLPVVDGVLATLVTVLATRYPEKTPHFMAYFHTITRASHNFEGAAWASYDMAYRRQAANQHSLDWGVVDLALYNEAFTGQAKIIPRCRYCLADSYDTKECCFAPEEGHLSGARAVQPAMSHDGV